MKDPVVFIQNALSPAQVLKVDFNEEAHACIVVVPDNQLSLAISKRGQNARLAARLTTYELTSSGNLLMLTAEKQPP